MLKGIILRDYADAPYATWVSEGVKTIETRKWATKHRGDLVICCSNGSESPNRGLVLCIVELYHIEPMIPEHELEACCRIYPNAKSWHIRNLRRFVKPFPTKGHIVGGSPQSIFEIEIPDDAVALYKETAKDHHHFIKPQTLFSNE